MQLGRCLQLFKFEEWYNNDIDRSREMVYDFKFGIFRVMGNAWAEKRYKTG